MDYNLTEEQQAIVDTAREIAQKKIKKVREHYDKTEEYPWEIVEEMRKADLFAQTMVCDYLFNKDKIFAYLNLDDNELFIYQRLYELLAREIPPSLALPPRPIPLRANS